MHQLLSIFYTHLWKSVVEVKIVEEIEKMVDAVLFTTTTKAASLENSTVLKLLNGQFSWWRAPPPPQSSIIVQTM